ncbi:zinc finger protein 58-like isoform X2 [Sabethes cyaneus]|uniref:zinc finger protein 58-like isoform X2 n=1 Tax=Sabethes cyaneus TaxID=53552 RepID=UPI00237D8A5E|nr:zinc finger protein 58-like isoform X2 [Sabethes cyaneus]
MPHPTKRQLAARERARKRWPERASKFKTTLEEYCSKEVDQGAKEDNSPNDINHGVAKEENVPLCEVKIEAECDESQIQHDPISIVSVEPDIKLENDCCNEEMTIDDGLKCDQPPIQSASFQQIIPIIERCKFCLRILDETIKMLFRPGKLHWKKIEFALSISLTVEPLCCVSCWQMIDLFDGFKRSCQMAFYKPEELLRSRQNGLCSEPATNQVPAFVKISAPVDSRPVKTSTNQDKHSAWTSWMANIPVKQDKKKTEKVKFLSCKQCSKQFAGFASFIAHKTTCRGYPCHICSTVLDTRQRLRMHYEQDHSDPFPFKCQKEGCDCEFSLQEALLTHEQLCELDTFDPIDCTICGFTMTSIGSVREHEDIHVQARFVCRACKAKFLDRNKLKIHWKKHIQKATETAGLESENEADNAMASDDTDTPSYFCPRKSCRLVFRSNTDLDIHVQHCGQKSGFICSVCGAVLMTPYTLRMHMANHEEPKVECETCGKKFHTEPQLRKHMGVHSNERKFQCKVCKKRFKSREANRVHQRIHTNEKPYACHICDQRFTYNCLLKTHLEKGHGERELGSKQKNIPTDSPVQQHEAVSLDSTQVFNIYGHLL